jgi:hypothetical protein
MSQRSCKAKGMLTHTTMNDNVPQPIMGHLGPGRTTWGACRIVWQW